MKRYTKEDLDKLFRETIGSLKTIRRKSWPSGCGWQLEIRDGKAFMVVIYDVETRHWERDGGCSDYCRYQSREVQVPL
jgi:hypothetical protein